MKILGLILGTLVLGAGLVLTALSWLHASSEGRIDAGAYAGPVLIIMGGLRVFRAITSMPPNLILRFVMLAIAIGVGFGHETLLKAVYPSAVSETRLSQQ